MLRARVVDDSRVARQKVIPNDSRATIISVFRRVTPCVIDTVRCDVFNLGSSDSI